MPEIIPQKLQDSEENYLNTTFWEIYPLFLLVRDGDSDRLKESLDIELEKFPIGRITRDLKTQLEYLTVSLVNTFMIAAIEGGVYPPDANEVADQALRRLSRMQSVTEFPSLVAEAALRLGRMAFEARNTATGNRHVEKARHYLDTHLTQEIHTEDVAAAVGLSPYHLCRLFKAETGQTMRRYLLESRLRTACQLLASSDYTIPQIASLLRFCDQSYFTKVFRESQGMTPKAYREQNRK